MKRLVCILALFVSGCFTIPPVVHEEPAVSTTPQPEEYLNAEPNRCPPLPVLRENATRFEGRLWTLTVTALYGQCAASKEPK